MVFAFFRFSLASSIFVVIMLLRGGRFPFPRNEWPHLFLLSILAIPINQVLFLIGLSYTLPTHPALLYATTPVWVYLLSVWRGEERTSPKKTIGIAVALAGVIAFFLEKGIALRLDYLFGDSLVMIAVLAWAGYSVLGRPLAQKRGVMNVTASASIIGTAVFFPFGLYFAYQFDYSCVTAIGWGGVAYTAVLTSVVAYTIWYWAIKRTAPSRVAIFMNLQPVTTAIMAYFLFGERLSAGSILSGIVILMGVYITQRG